MNEHTFEIRRMRPEEAQETAELIRATIKPLAYYSEYAKTAETSKYGAQQPAESVESDPDSVLQRSQL